MKKWERDWTRAWNKQAIEAHNKRKNEIELSIHWGVGLHPIGDPNPLTRLLGNIEIAGANFHVEAWQVETNKHGEQECKDPNAADWYDYISGNLVDGAGQTVEIAGREYFIVISPFQE
jgi:hypothetical protein